MAKNVVIKKYDNGTGLVITGEGEGNVNRTWTRPDFEANIAEENKFSFTVNGKKYGPFDTDEDTFLNDDEEIEGTAQEVVDAIRPLFFLASGGSFDPDTDNEFSSDQSLVNSTPATDNNPKASPKLKFVGRAFREANNNDAAQEFDVYVLPQEAGSSAIPVLVLMPIHNDGQQSLAYAAFVGTYQSNGPTGLVIRDSATHEEYAQFSANRSSGEIIIGATSSGGYLTTIFSNGQPRMTFTTGGPIVLRQASEYQEYANDAAAAAGDIPVGGIYKTGSVLKVRVS